MIRIIQEKLSLRDEIFSAKEEKRDVSAIVSEILENVSNKDAFAFECS